MELNKLYFNKSLFAIFFIIIFNSIKKINCISKLLFQLGIGPNSKIAVNLIYFIKILINLIIKLIKSIIIQ